MKEATLKKFGVKPEDGPTVKTWAFNQGFYNLFLALGLVYSIVLLYGRDPEGGKTLARFILLSITGAGLVLFSSNPKKYLAALIQGVPALIAFLLTFFL